jgi:hypothetical protein
MYLFGNKMTFLYWKIFMLRMGLAIYKCSEILFVFLTWTQPYNLIFVWVAERGWLFCCSFTGEQMDMLIFLDFCHVCLFLCASLRWKRSGYHLKRVHVFPCNSTYLQHNKVKCNTFTSRGAMLVPIKQCL